MREGEQVCGKGEVSKGKESRERKQDISESVVLGLCLQFPRSLFLPQEKIRRPGEANRETRAVTASLFMTIRVDTPIVW